ncbi:uncharacterized protein [Amphiura filiformis]|uniref:uncharacterized protein n=1 Tax=Amphiura filiformis TaxID=82378 RepID=UPI003B222D54
MVILNFLVRLKTTNRTKSTRIKFNLDRLKDPNISDSFKATVGGKFAPLLMLNDNDSFEMLTSKFNEIMIEAATETLEKHRRKTQKWVTEDILDMCDKRRKLKKDKNTPAGTKGYKKVSKQIRQSMNKAKDHWIKKQCTELEESLEKNNSRRAFQIVNDLTKPRQPRVKTIQDKEGNCLTEEEDILKRWTEYCSDLFNHQTNGDPSVTISQESSNNDDFPVLREEVEKAIKSLQNGKAPGIDNITAELIRHGGEMTIDILTVICNKIWQSGDWPTPWTQVAHHHAPQERQPAKMPELQNHQFNQSLQ